ncbi:hypothetical protein [Bacillus cereus group sp. BfR-BA-01380]|uniref:hypothetical protein n=1 Tax=Bacillus cereus group sp. BfR-BA-01380 TaxID=2920324 RepID=UPI001F57C507|nr:hypothetical protein [Bacillus cereus group sp. BfR-BA-01380]
MQSQLSFEDILGTFDYTATSTAEKFLAKEPVIKTFAVDFFDKDEKQKLRWFEAEVKGAAISAARKKYGKILINNIYISDKTLKEIMEMD